MVCSQSTSLSEWHFFLTLIHLLEIKTFWAPKPLHSHPNLARAPPGQSQATPWEWVLLLHPVQPLLPKPIPWCAAHTVHPRHPPRGSASLHHPRGWASPPIRGSYSQAVMQQCLNTLPRLWDRPENIYPDFSFFLNPTSIFNLPKKTPTDSLLGGNNFRKNSSSLSLQRSAANSTNPRRWPSLWCRDEAKIQEARQVLEGR